MCYCHNNDYYDPRYGQMPPAKDAVPNNTQNKITAGEFKVDPKNGIELSEAGFRYNPQNGWYTHDEITTKGRIRSIAVLKCKYLFTIIINPKDNDLGEAYECTYMSNGNKYNTIISDEELHSPKLYERFPEIDFGSKCPVYLKNGLLKSLILYTNNRKTLPFPKRQGWNIVEVEVNTGDLFDFLEKSERPVFLHYEKTYEKYKKYISESIKERTFPDIKINFTIVDGLRQTFKTFWQFKMLILLRVASIILYYLGINNITPKQIFVVEPSKSVIVNVLIAILKTSNYSSFDTVSIDSKETAIQRELDNINDGIALFTGNGLDDSKDVKNNLKCLLRECEQKNGNKDYSRKIIAIISDTIIYSAHKLSPETFCRLSFEDISEDIDPLKIQMNSGILDYYIIEYFGKNYSEMQKEISEKLVDIHMNAPQTLTPNNENTYFMIAIANFVIEHIFNCSFLNDDDISKILEAIKPRYVLESGKEEVIKRDFASVVNELLINNSLSIVKKDNHLCFESGSNTVIAVNNNICFEGCIIDDIIIPKMSLNIDHRALINALDKSGCLYTTDNECQRLDIYDENNNPKSYYMYSISKNILNRNIARKIDNIALEEFFFTPNEFLPENFLPFIYDIDENIAGIKVSFKDKTNRHIVITGEPGSGKSTFISQLAAWYANMGIKVIIFDSSDTFIQDELTEQLLPEFVESNYTLHNIDEEGVPVNIFNINNSKNKINELLGILISPFEELSESQLSALSNSISDIAYYEDLSTYKIMSTLEREAESSESLNKTYDSLNNKLKPVLQGILDCGMADQTWDEFLSNSKNIVVISKSYSYAKKKVPVFDLLLTTLYNSQIRSNGKPLVIIVDEVHKQNTAEGSPLDLIIRESRKKHISVITANQEYYISKSGLRRIMSKAKIKVFFKPESGSVDDVAKELKYKKTDSERFDTMETGDCILKADCYSKDKERNCNAILLGKVCKFEDYYKRMQSQSSLSSNVLTLQVPEQPI